MDKSLIINKIIEAKKFKSDADFARFLGISSQSLSKWKARNTYDIELLYTKCPDLNPDWLFTGEGSIFRNELQQEEVPTNENELITLLREKVKDKEMIIKEKTKNIELLEERLKELKEQVKQLSRQKVSAPSVNYGPFPSVPSL